VKPTNLPVFFGGSSDEAIDVAGRHADVYALWGETLAQVREMVERVRASAARYRRRVGFSMSLRPVLAGTEEAAWKRADEIVERVRALRESTGAATSGHAPPNAGSRRLLQTAAQGYRVDKRLWTGVAAIGGALRETRRGSSAPRSKSPTRCSTTTTSASTTSSFAGSSRSRTRSRTAATFSRSCASLVAAARAAAGSSPPV
jgi:hypothetical protein